MLVLFVVSTAAVAAPARGAVTPRLPAAAISQLRTSSYAVVEGYLNPAQVQLIKNDVDALRTEGRFKVAGVGDAADNRLDDDVRRCEQCFLYPTMKHGGGGHAEGRTLLYEVLDGVRDSLQVGTSTQLDSLLTEGLYAAYPQGGFYRRHVDAFPGTPQEIRAFSYLLYFNEGWTAADGGQLRLHTDGGGEQRPPNARPSYVDVEPKAGTLAIFRSDLPHEVLDTAAPRLAVAGWFNTPPQGSSARRGLIAALGGALVVGGAVKAVGGLLGSGGGAN